MAEEHRRHTSESVTVSYTIAGIGSRFLAALIDALVITGMTISLLIVAVLLSLAGDVGASTGTFLALTGLFLLQSGYFIIYEALWSGQTPGKRALDIRVIRTTGYPIGLPESAIRNVVRVVDFLPALYGIGLVCMFVSRQSRRLGDLAAGTIVVREKAPMKVAELSCSGSRIAGGPAQPALGHIDPEELEWNLECVTAADLQLARAFLERAPALERSVRQRIGDEIAIRVAGHIGAREPLDSATFLQRVLYLHATDE